MSCGPCPYVVVSTTLGTHPLVQQLKQCSWKAGILQFHPVEVTVQDIDEEEGIAAVHEAFKLGINFFDTSPFYGVTKSEAVLGKALKSLPRDEIIVATKVGRYGPTEFDFSAERVTREFHKSLERLNVEFVDILQCHDIEFADIDQVLSLIHI